MPDGMCLQKFPGVIPNISMFVPTVLQPRQTTTSVLTLTNLVARTSLLVLHPSPRCYTSWTNTRAHTRQLNYQVLSLLGTTSNIHENMILPKLDTFLLPRNEGPIMDTRDEHWSMIKHEDEGMRSGNKNGASSGYYRTLTSTKCTIRHFIIFV